MERYNNFKKIIPKDEFQWFCHQLNLFIPQNTSYISFECLMKDKVILFIYSFQDILKRNKYLMFFY